MRKRPLLQIACVFLTGLAYQRYKLLLLACIGLLPIAWECYIGRKINNIQKAAGRGVLLLSAFLFGIFHMQQEQEFRVAYMSKIVDGSRITVWGELIKWETTEYGNRGILSDCYIDFGEEKIPCNDIMVYTSNDQYSLGQIQKTTGKIKRFSAARNEGNFDALMYYQSLKIDFAVEEEECEILENCQSLIRRSIFSLSERLAAVYEASLSQRATGFYQAMVLGDKANLDKNLKDLFLLGGISHILAISGLHVSILGRGVYGILRRRGIGFGIAGLCGGALLIAYCSMVGGSVSTVRAVGMMLCFFLAQWIGRGYEMLNALGGMALILLWDNPFLIENSGFWFSVTALIGVGVVGQRLCQRVEDKRKGKIFSINGIWMSIGITLTTLPVTALSYYEIPMYSILVNLIVLPLLTPIFILALIGGGVGVILPGIEIARILLLPCEWGLILFEGICTVVSWLPFSSIICGEPSWWQVGVYYLLLFGAIYMKGKRLVYVLLIACMGCMLFPKPKPFEMTFLDVGQGDGVYISAGDGTTYFIDGGSSNVNGVGEERILPFLKSKAVQSIDYWFVSHCDMDHISGLLEIIEKGYKIEHIVLHERCSYNENYDSLIKLTRKKGIEIVEMKTGERVRSKEIEIVCLAPLKGQASPIGNDTNENSLILQMEWKEKSNQRKRALFAGDISTEVEEALCKAGVLENVDIFKANHHGSNYSNGTSFLEKIKPEYIVVSCGERNYYGHPGKQAIQRMEACGAKIFYTMYGGQITFPLVQ